ncbi:MAG: CRISPR-associated protein Cas4 [Acidobacteria bacterium]|nr:CRISPR-associated protein Cas4 [Acidobacteriota bacterium]
MRDPDRERNARAETRRAVAERVFERLTASEGYQGKRYQLRSIIQMEKKATYKMERGKLEEARLDQLERRRKLRKYGLGEGKRFFHVWLSSERLGLSGKLDLLIETSQGLFPVDFKWTSAEPHRNHLFRLAGYALLVEENHGRPASTGFIHLIPKEDAVVIEITEALKKECLTKLDEIRRMISNEQLPDPTPFRNRCVDCEYRNYCRDIF